eukprot:6730859-Heterocapsa_arctica.AAC.1
MRPATSGVARQGGGRRFCHGRSHPTALAYGRALPARRCADSAPTSPSALRRLAGSTLVATERSTRAAATARTPS